MYKEDKYEKVIDEQVFQKQQFSDSSSEDNNKLNESCEYEYKIEDESKVYNIQIDPDKIIKYIPLMGRRKVVVQALCDEEDYDGLISLRSWAYDEGYGHNSSGRMHTVIMNLRGIRIPKGYCVHHINHIRHDNRFSNLVIIPISRNSQSQKKKQNQSSKYYGVSVYRGRIKASVIIDARDHLIGTFDTEEIAAEAYDRYISHQGSFHQMNQPEKRDQYKNEPLMINRRNPAETGFRGTRVMGKRFEGYLQIDNKTYRKAFDTSTEAAKWFDQQVVKHKLDRPLNFPNDYPTYQPYRKIKTTIIKDFKNGTVQISLKSRPKLVLIIDKKDYPLIKYHNISLDNKGYPKLHIKRKGVFLSRFLLGVTDSDIWVDHGDSNPLNNSRKNLSLSDCVHNSRNLKKRAGTSSSYYNVVYNKDEKKWVAEITHHEKRIFRAKYDTEEYAARHYDLFVMEEKSNRKMNFIDWNEKVIKEWQTILNIKVPGKIEQQFYDQPNVDPRTGKKIIVGKCVYNQLVKLYGEPPKITSPKSKTKICVNKDAYKKLIKEGYTDDELLYGIKTNKNSK